MINYMIKQMINLEKLASNKTNQKIFF